MSTNYYLPTSGPADLRDLYERHVGKLTGTGKGESMFIWAVEPEIVMAEIKRRGVVSEYGQLLSGADFNDVLKMANQHDFDSVGTVFC